MKSIKIGIIGAGRIGRVHAENIAKFVTEMEIKTIAGPYMSQETIEFLQRLRIPNIVKDADVILKDPEIKAVAVCSPTDLHAEYAIKAAEGRRPSPRRRRTGSSSRWASTAASTTTTGQFTRRSEPGRWAR